MSIKAALQAGHSFITGDNITAELLNKAFETAKAIIPTPFSVANGGTGGTSAADAQKNLEAQGRLAAWIEFDSPSGEVELGTLPADCFVDDVKIEPTVAFDSGTADTVEVGWDADHDALSAAQDVQSTGVKNPTMGANEGYNGTSQTIKAYHTTSGTAPTQGKALVIVFLAQVPTEPS